MTVYQEMGKVLTAKYGVSSRLKFVVDASRLACWLGKPVDASRKSEKMVPSKLTHIYFPYSCFFFVYLLLCYFKAFQ